MLLDLKLRTAAFAVVALASLAETSLAHPMRPFGHLSGSEEVRGLSERLLGTPSASSGTIPSHASDGLPAHRLGTGHPDNRASSSQSGAMGSPNILSKALGAFGEATAEFSPPPTMPKKRRHMSSLNHDRGRWLKLNPDKNPETDMPEILRPQHNGPRRLQDPQAILEYELKMREKRAEEGREYRRRVAEKQGRVFIPIPAKGKFAPLDTATAIKTYNTRLNKDPPKVATDGGAAERGTLKQSSGGKPSSSHSSTGQQSLDGAEDRDSFSSLLANFTKSKRTDSLKRVLEKQHFGQEITEDDRAAVMAQAQGLVDHQLASERALAQKRGEVLGRTTRLRHDKRKAMTYDRAVSLLTSQEKAMQRSNKRSETMRPSSKRQRTSEMSGPVAPTSPARRLAIEGGQRDVIHSEAEHQTQALRGQHSEPAALQNTRSSPPNQGIAAPVGKGSDGESDSAWLAKHLRLGSSSASSSSAGRPVAAAQHDVDKSWLRLGPESPASSHSPGQGRRSADGEPRAEEAGPSTDLRLGLGL